MIGFGRTRDGGSASPGRAGGLRNVAAGHVYPNQDESNNAKHTFRNRDPSIMVSSKSTTRSVLMPRCPASVHKTLARDSLSQNKRLSDETMLASGRAKFAELFLSLAKSLTLQFA